MKLTSTIFEMLKNIKTFFILIISIPLFAQNNDTISSSGVLNFQFRKTMQSQEVPDGWFAWRRKNEYDYLIDSNVQRSGYNSVLITPSKNITSPTFGCLAKKIPAKYIGREITLNAYMKFESVSDFVGLMLRIEDSGGNLLKFANLQEKKINGTKDWELYSIKLPLPKEAQNIYIGPILGGKGNLWINELQLLIDGKPLNEAKVKADFNLNAIQYGNNRDAGHRIKINDAELYYETYGDGEPLLLLHGNSQSIYAFNQQISALSKRFKVIAVDTRAHGNSKDYSTGPLTYDLFAEDMKVLLDSLHISKTSILGWSDGGNTGLIMAIKYPSYVKKLAVMGAVLFSSKESVKSKNLNEVSKTIQSIKDKNDSQSKKRIRLYSMLLNEPRMTFENLHLVSCPVLVMAGEHDMILEKHTKGIATHIKNSKLVIFENASHFAPVEKVSEFNNAVLNFYL